MSNHVTSAVIGQLTQDKQFADWWQSPPVAIPFFENCKLPIIVTGYEPGHDATFVEEADQALTHFFGLNTTDRNAVSQLAYKNCIEFLDAVDDDEEYESLREIEDPNDIWKFIQPAEIYVSRRAYQEQDIYVQVACECDWEQEHGLQLVFRQGKKLTRISDNDGHLTEADAYGKPDEEDELLSKF
jgi:hypothetical protein